MRHYDRQTAKEIKMEIGSILKLKIVGWDHWARPLYDFVSRKGLNDLLKKIKRLKRKASKNKKMFGFLGI